MEDSIVKKVFDTVRPNRGNPIYAMQGDYSARFIQANITSEGSMINVPTTAAVTIGARRPDGESKAYIGEANSDGSVTVPIVQWMLEVTGEVSCTITVTMASDNKKLSTQPFIINATKTPYNGNSVSEDDPNYDLLTTIIKSEEVRVANENARVSAESARKSAEALRIENEAVRVSNESERVSAETLRDEKFEKWEGAMKLIFIEDIDNDKQYGYQLKIEGGKPKLYLDEI